MSDDLSFDHIVVGSGSAGAVVANRLSENGRNRVLLLEAGTRDSNPWIHIPAGFARLFTDPRTQWGDVSAPEPELNGRSIYYSHGKVLGGSSSVNGLLYVRGQRADYDHWRDLGNLGWGYEDVLPFFRRAESHVHGDTAHHGGTGPIRVIEQPAHELVDAFISAAGEIGVPRNQDLNGADAEGAGYYQLTSSGRRRYSTAVGYLRPARHRRNLVIATNATARRIVFDGRTASAVEYEQNGEKRRAKVTGEIIVCAGVFNSPHLLQLSGVGPAANLAAAGLAVTHDLPGVGENLQDHLIASFAYECRLPITMNDAIRSPWGKLRAAAAYLAAGRGPMTMGASYGGGFFRAGPGSNRPDLQCFFSMYSSPDFKEPDPFPGMTVGIFQSHPQSRGSVRTVAPDPGVRPEIRANYLHEEFDRAQLLSGLRLISRLMEGKHMADYMKRRVRPDINVDDNNALLAWVRDTGTSALHGVGTCRMGADPLAVVDSRLRVHGLNRIRVADGSVMPTIVSGNTSAPIMMIGEKAADMVLADAA